MATEDIKNKSSQEQQMPDKGRRDALKTLATVPVLGALAYGVYKTRKNALQSRNISDVFQVSNKQAVFLEPQKDGKQIRLGIIGFGIRGKQLMRAAGFAEPSWIDEMKEANRKNKKDHRYEQYLEQDDLNVVVNGVCDIFDVYGEAAQLAGSNIYPRAATASSARRPSATVHTRSFWPPRISTRSSSPARTIGTARWPWTPPAPESMSTARNRFHGRFLRPIWFAR